MADAGALRRAPLPARGGLHGRAGPGPSLVHPCGERHAPRNPESRCLALRRRPHAWNIWCAMRFSKSAPRRVVARAIRPGVERKMSRYPVRHRGPLARAANPSQSEIALPDPQMDTIGPRILLKGPKNLGDREKSVLVFQSGQFLTSPLHRGIAVLRQLCLTAISFIGGSRGLESDQCLSHAFSPISLAHSLIGLLLLG